MKSPTTLLTLVLLAVLQPVQGQQGFSLPGMDLNKASASLHARLADDVVQLAITIDVNEGWHLYHDVLGHPEAIGLPTVVSFEGAGVTFSPARFPEPHRFDQSELSEGAWINGHEGSLVVWAEGRLDTPGSLPAISAHLEGLTCEDSGSCVPYSADLQAQTDGGDGLFADFPSDDLFSAPANGTASGELTASSETLGEETAAWVEYTDEEYAAVEFPAFEPRTSQANHSLGGWLAIAFLAGMILNVMPCVLPVISIKILSFVQQAGEDKQRILALGLSFAAGIVVVFLVLASLAVSFKLGWGEQFQSQTFIVVMIGLVFAFALSMFGVYELGVPAGVGELAGAAPREGLGDAFFKGMLATVLATPCSGPFLGSTLTWTVSQPAPVVYGIFLFLGLGMAFPYVVLTANPKLLKMIPKPGAWMDTFKESMGFVLMATVVYLMISLRQELMLFTVSFLVFVAMGCWWWGRFSVRAPSKGRRMATLVVAVSIAALGWRVSFHEFKGLFESEDAGWEEFDPVAFASYLEEGQSVLVDFTASWCPNCKYNEKFVFNEETVVEALNQKDVIRIRADISVDSARTAMLTRLQNSLGGYAIPFVAVFPGDAVNEPHTRFDIVGKDDMLELISALP